MAFPDIVIGSSFDAKGFRQAETAATKLNKTIKNLAGTFGIAFGTQAIVNFGKASVKAFVEDENAARSLSVTIKNLGLDFGNNTVLVGQFIDTVEKQTGVLDDELRPAMDRLLRATGDVAESQELLNLALDVSAGTGKTVTQVSQSLQKAYLGQTAALGRLGVGLSKAELATGDFEDIQQKLTKLFAGQALSAANSYAGQLAKLQVAANNAKETIGEGLVDALKLLAGDTSIDKLNEGLEKTALYIADVIRGVGVFIQKLKEIPIAGKAFQIPLDGYIQAIPVIGAYISILADLGKEQRTLAGLTTNPISPYYAKKQAEAAAKAAAAKIAADRKAALAEKNAAAAKIAADKKASAAKIAADKKAADNAAKLSKAGAMFDLDKIQIEAALKGKITDEETLRLQLQRAILNEDATLADELQKRLEASQRATATLQGQISGIRAPVDPFAERLKSLENIAELLGKLGGMSFGKPGGGVLALEPNDTISLDTKPKVTPTPTPTITDPIPVVVIPSPNPMPSTNGSMAGLGGGGPFYGQELPWYMRTTPAPAPTINVTVQGSVLTENDFVDVVNKAVITANTNGLNNSRPGSLTVTE